jgi:hypothetical protein
MFICKFIFGRVDTKCRNFVEQGEISVGKVKVKGKVAPVLN